MTIDEAAFKGLLRMRLARLQVSGDVMLSVVQMEQIASAALACARESQAD